MKRNWCDHGICTSCGNPVAWVRDPSGFWRLVDAGPEHECEAGGYRASVRAARRARQSEVSEEVFAVLVAQLGAKNGAGGHR